MKEADVVSHLIDNWEFYMREFNLDYITNEYPINIRRRGIHSKIDVFAYKLRNDNFRVPIFMEVKYSGTGVSRDLMLELQKLLLVRKYHSERMSEEFSKVGICVIADGVDKPTLEFMRNNRIMYLQYEVLNKLYANDDKWLKIYFNRNEK